MGRAVVRFFAARFVFYGGKKVQLSCITRFCLGHSVNCHSNLFLRLILTKIKIQTHDSLNKNWVADQIIVERSAWHHCLKPQNIERYFTMTPSMKINIFDSKINCVDQGQSCSTVNHGGQNFILQRAILINVFFLILADTRCNLEYSPVKNAVDYLFSQPLMQTSWKTFSRLSQKSKDLHWVNNICLNRLKKWQTNWDLWSQVRAKKKHRFFQISKSQFNPEFCAVRSISA